jgi:hypothetical protein
LAANVSLLELTFALPKAPVVVVLEEVDVVLEEVEVVPGEVDVVAEVVLVVAPTVAYSDISSSSLEKEPKLAVGPEL